VEPQTPAALAGIQKGDQVVGINDQQILDWEDFTTMVGSAPSQYMTLEVLRAQKVISLQATTTVEGTLGVYPKVPDIEFTNVSLSLGSSIQQGFAYGYWTLYDYVAQFKYIFTKKGAAQVGGFGAIGNLFPPAWDWRGFWSSTALISIMLAFMNVLPIPALDGGHVMFLLYEMISGRKPHDRFLEYAQIFGFILLMSLVLYANGNDLYRAIFG